MQKDDTVKLVNEVCDDYYGITRCVPGKTDFAFVKEYGKNKEEKFYAT
jgi:hypothetical protein